MTDPAMRPYHHLPDPIPPPSPGRLILERLRRQMAEREAAEAQNSRFAFELAEAALRDHFKGPEGEWVA